MALFNRLFSWVVSALFPVCRYFLSKRATTFFLLKTDVLFYIIFPKRTSHLKTGCEKNEEILA